MIALLCATPFEMECVSSRLCDVAKIDSPRGMKLASGVLGETDILVLAGGIGKVAAAAASMYVIEKWEPAALINYGIAGALSSDVSVGDVIIGDGLVQGDLGVVHSRGFKMTGPGLHHENHFAFSPYHPVSPTLLERCLDVAQRVSFPCRRGRIVTCDQILLDPELRRELAVLFNALAVDMEGAAAAQVAASRDTDFIDVRAVSDEASFDLVGLEKLLPMQGQSRRHIVGKYLWLRLMKPSLLMGIRELGQGRDAALRNIAAFLEELLPTLPRV